MLIKISTDNSDKGMIKLNNWANEIPQDDDPKAKWLLIWCRKIIFIFNLGFVK